MRIAHVITRLLRAGSEENTLLTSAGQIADGHEVLILHGRDSMPHFARQMAPGVELVAVPSLERDLSPANDLRAYRALREQFVALRPDVVHTHQSKAGIVGRLAAASAGTRAIVHGVHINPFIDPSAARRALYFGAEKAAATVTDAFIHVSEGMQAAYKARKVGAGRVHRIVNSGFDLRRFAEATPPDDWRALLGVAPDAPKPPVVAMLASLEERKQHLPFLERVPALLERWPDARILLAGEGPMKEAIEEAIATRGLGGRVIPLGYRSDPERIIALADLCLLCSRLEGLPRSVLQYLAAGRVPVVFQVEGIERLVRNGHNGHVLAQGDWDGFMGAVANLLQDDVQRGEMTRHARESDLSPWDAALMAGRTLAVYEDAFRAQRRVGRRPRRPAADQTSS